MFFPGGGGGGGYFIKTFATLYSVCIRAYSPVAIVHVFPRNAYDLGRDVSSEVITERICCDVTPTIPQLLLVLKAWWVVSLEQVPGHDVGWRKWNGEAGNRCIGWRRCRWLHGDCCRHVRHGERDTTVKNKLSVYTFDKTLRLIISMQATMNACVNTLTQSHRFKT